MQCLRLPGAVTSHNVPVCSSLRTASGARLVQAARPALAVARAARPACSASQQPPKQRQQQQQLAAQRPASGGGAAPSAAMLAALWTLAAQLPASAAELELSGGPPASSYYVSLGLFLMSVPGELTGEGVVAACTKRRGCTGAAGGGRARHCARRPASRLMLLGNECTVGCKVRMPSSRCWHCPSVPPPCAGLWSLIKRSPKAKIKRKTFEVAGPAEVSEQASAGAGCTCAAVWPAAVDVYPILGGGAGLQAQRRPPSAQQQPRPASCAFPAPC